MPDKLYTIVAHEHLPGSLVRSNPQFLSNACYHVAAKLPRNLSATICFNIPAIEPHFADPHFHPARLLPAPSPRQRNKLSICARNTGAFLPVESIGRELARTAEITLTIRPGRTCEPIFRTDTFGQDGGRTGSDNRSLPTHSAAARFHLLPNCRLYYGQMNSSTDSWHRVSEN